MVKMPKVLHESRFALSARVSPRQINWGVLSVFFNELSQKLTMEGLNNQKIFEGRPHCPV